MDFSIIIPARNEEANIGRCLDSINLMEFDQTCYEVLMIDNGSLDGTIEVAREKGAQVFMQPGLTISGLRNYGAKEAQGRILVFLDADCSVAKDWLLEASRYLDNDQVVCFGSAPVIPVEATWVQKAWFQVRRKPETVQVVEWFESMNMFVRREAFFACGGFDESLSTCEDYDLSIRLQKKGSLLSDSRIVAIHHGEAATVGHFFRKEMWRATSNFRGLLRHGFVLREIPSLVAPTGHCLLLALLILSPVLLPLSATLTVFLLFLLWQAVLFLTSIRKQSPATEWISVAQLYWLLNVYFTARGLAVFKGGRR